jgi:hypothetical protein
VPGPWIDERRAAWQPPDMSRRDPYWKRLQNLLSSEPPVSEEQTLLILRVDKGMSWEDIAEVMRADGEQATPAALQ